MTSCIRHVDMEHRLTVAETIILAMGETVKDIKSVINMYGVSAIVTLVLGFTGIIATILVK